MAAHVARLSRLFTPEYARQIKAQIVHCAQSVVVKPNKLESSLSQPVNVSIYEPDRSAPQLAATLSFGIIKGHPFLDGNKRTAFFLGNEYIRAMGTPGLADAGKVGDVYKSILDIAQQHIDVAVGKLDVEGLAKEG